jgi:hypothetical protein
MILSQNGNSLTSPSKDLQHPKTRLNMLITFSTLCITTKNDYLIS